MSRSTVRCIVVYDQVLAADDRHCDNSCQHMAYPQAMRRLAKLVTVRCDMFDVELVWDKRRKKNGYIRCGACRNAEDNAEELTL